MRNETMRRSLLSDEISEGIKHDKIIQKAIEWRTSLKPVFGKNNTSRKAMNKHRCVTNRLS